MLQLLSTGFLLCLLFFALFIFSYVYFFFCVFPYLYLMFKVSFFHMFQFFLVFFFPLFPLIRPSTRFHLTLFPCSFEICQCFVRVLVSLVFLDLPSRLLCFSTLESCMFLFFYFVFDVSTTTFLVQSIQAVTKFSVVTRVTYRLPHRLWCKTISPHA